MSLRTIFTLCGLGVLVALASAAPRPITHEDVWLMPRVGSPEISPDGKRVVVAVTTPAYDPKDVASDLWLLSTDGSAPPRRLTHSKGAETGASWSPDGRRIAFSARREDDDANQLYVLDLAAGGDAERITALSTGARSPQWSPDGKHLLFLSQVYPGAKDDAANRRAAKERRDRKWNARVHDGFPIRHWDRWLDERQGTVLVQEAKAGAAPRDLLAGSALAAVPGFGGALGESGESFPAVWTPDGTGVLFAATTGRDRAAHAPVETDLFLVSLGGGEPQRLVEDADSYGAPVFSPDGRTLVVTLTPGGTGKVYNRARLAAYPWPFDATARRVLTEAFDRGAGRAVFSPDGATVYFTAEERGLEPLWRVPLAGGEVTSAREMKEGVLSGLGGGGAGADFRLVSLWETAVRPAEVYSHDPATGRTRTLSTFTKGRLDGVDLAPLEAFEFTSTKGRKIHSFVVRPPGFDAARMYPLVVVIHGGPHSMFRDQFLLRWNYHLLAKPGYVVLLTNYTGSTGFGEAFAQGIQGEPLRTPGEELNEAADEAVRRYAFIDSDRRAAAGASYGGHLAMWLQATTSHYKALISHAGLVSLESQWGTSDAIYSRERNNGGPVWEQGPVWRDQSPWRYAGDHATGKGWVTPMLITAGELDYRVPLNNALEAWSLHQRLQIPSRLITFPDENHWILKGENSRFWYAEVHAWLAKWLEPKP
jgi:dipeptidyl aminopeptidase/acylaminoacyl peptidase